MYALLGYFTKYNWSKCQPAQQKLKKMGFCGANQTGDVFFIISKDYIININNLTSTIFNNYCYMYLFDE